MTDNEIKKALECCLETRHDCSDCLLEKEVHCTSVLHKNILDFINRQQAEIEKLQSAVQEWVDGKCLSQKHLLMIGNLQNEIEQAKSEAIKEFAERLKKEAVTKCDWDNCVDVEDIDKLAAEMVGEQNA